MHLQVGELARASGLTVRTLHHYDEIGLLRPSARSEGGYRLYNADDVARLHAIQALRHLGLALGDIAPVLDGRGASIEAILEQQMQALQQQIRQATELHGRLALLREGLLHGPAPRLEDWVRSLGLMATYGKYFSASELQAIFGGWSAIEAELRSLQQQLRSCMERASPPESPEVQALAWRWMQAMHRWMGGDFQLLDRWGAMFRQETAVHGQGGAPPSDMLAYIDAATALRMQLLHAHFEGDGFQRVRQLPEEELLAVEREGQALLRAGRGPRSRPARELLARWLDVLDRAAQGDAHVAAKLRTLHTGHPLLVVGSPVSREVRAFLHEVAEAA